MARRTESREFISDFLHLYHQHPTLWKIKSSEYRDRKQKSEAYRVLIEKYKQIDPKANKETVKRKLNSLRTNYRKELKKVIASCRLGSGTDDIYVPSLWYFNELSFLQDQEELPIETCSATISQNEDENNVEEEKEQVTNMDVIPLFKQQSKPSIKLSPRNYKSSSNVTSQKELLNVTCKHLKMSDEYEYLGIAWVNELKKMRADQQIHAKKAINDILYEGQLGTLHRHSIKINDSSEFSSSEIH
ncbi:hypothetical protein ABEB36_003155 [Hypothenemus hampei]|uniref:MADF domain-containing protein n=1 Tax=Hypothenemus hampei TaxID=57062 RepID=A0ABD1FBV3_HYPHA